MPASHSIFESLTDAQWWWYFYNFEKDDHEKFVRDRDFIEYLASFTNPEAVKKIKEGRDNTYVDTNFDQTIEKVFGKKVDLSKIPQK